VKTLLALALACAALSAHAQANEVPAWFSESFLEFPQDVKEAAADGKRLMLYFWQDGCPACSKMKATTLADPAIVETTRRHFVAVALNVFGERELQWTDGRTLREKDLARALNVLGTPTWLFLDEQGAVAQRTVGYTAPERFAATLGEAKRP
jgi:thioredoxin-related protein